jgi:hypothetical protein
MNEAEKDAEDRAKEEAKLPWGKNASASKLIDAAIWIFFVAGFCIVTSVFYVFGLSEGLHFDFRTYFAIKDYLEVTPYWLGGPFVIAIVLMVVFEVAKYFKDKDKYVFRLKPEPGQKWFPWLHTKVGRIATVSIALVVFLFFFITPPLAFPGLRVIVPTLGIYWLLDIVLNTKVVTEGAGSSLIAIRRNRPFLWQGIHLLLTVGMYAVLLGIIWEPIVLLNKPISNIYLAGSNSEVQGRVLFSLTRYLMIMRKDETVVAISVAKVDRIEMPIEQATGSKTAPPTTPSLSISTQAPNAPLSPRAQRSAPVSATPTPKLSPVPTPTLAPSP